MEKNTQGVTALLLAWNDGQQDALERLVPLVYEDLRRVAGARLRGEVPGHSLQPTALVHEVYMRLVDQRRAQWRNRAHFFGVAAGLMRRVLVDHVRARLADKRGGRVERVTLSHHDIIADAPDGVDVLALHDSLNRLATFDARKARIVELRYFGGLTIQETAEVVQVSEATVVREWTIALAWLRADLSGHTV